MICAHRIRHWLKHRAQLPGAHLAHFKRCTRRVNQNIFDMHMTEIAAPYRFIAIGEGYEAVKGGYLGHVHIKDVLVDTPRATLDVRRMGTGQLGPMFQPMADAMRADQYDGVISFESVFHPGNGDFEDGFRQCIGLFKEIFG